MQYVAVFGTQYNSSLSSFVPNFIIPTQVVAEKSLTEKMSICYNVLYKSGRRKKNEKLKKRQMRISILFFIYTVHFVYLKMYTKY